VGQCLVTDVYKIPGDISANTLTPSTVGISKEILDSICEPLNCFFGVQSIGGCNGCLCSRLTGAALDGHDRS